MEQIEDIKRTLDSLAKYVQKLEKIIEHQQEIINELIDKVYKLL